MTELDYLNDYENGIDYGDWLLSEAEFLERKFHQELPRIKTECVETEPNWSWGKDPKDDDRTYREVFMIEQDRDEISASDWQEIVNIFYSFGIH